MNILDKWKKIKNLSLYIEDGNNKYAISFPKYLEIKTNLELLDFLYNKEKSKVNKYSKINSITQRNLYNKYFFDFYSNILTYTIILCETEKLLAKYYKLDVTIYNKYINKEKSIKIDARFIKERSGEISKYKKWRDKVFAHTAYSSPWDDDNESDKVTSLFFLGKKAHRFEKTHFSLGGMNAMVDNKDPNTKLKVISIYTDHQFIKYHFDKWKEHLDKMLAFDYSRHQINITIH